MRHLGRSHLRFVGPRLLAALALAVSGLAVAGPAATAATTAGVDPAPAGSAFRSGHHVYVYPGGNVLVDPKHQATIESSLSGTKVYLAVVKTPAIGRADAKPLSDALSAAGGGKGSYVLLGVGGAGTFLQISSPVDPTVYGRQVRAAIAAHHDDPAGQAAALVTALAGDKLPTKPFPWTGVIVGVALGVAFLLLVLVVWSRQRRLRRLRLRRSDAARVEVETLDR